MPLTRTQVVLRKLLPDGVFEWLYCAATTGYYTWQKIADWLYYNTPKRDLKEQVMVSVIKDLLPYTMVGRGGLIATYKVVQEMEKQEIEGCLVECGIARGGSTAMMLLASLLSRSPTLGGRQAWLFDSFMGLPAPTNEDGELRKPRGKDKSSWDLAKGHCLGVQEEVEDLIFHKLGFPRSTIHLVKGWFQDTLSRYREQVGDIAVLRIDGDWYESTKCCLENLYGSVVDGGYVILDDYALVGCRRAVDEFFGHRKLEIVLDGRGGGWFRKNGSTR